MFGEIDPTQIAQDSFDNFKQALDSTIQVSPERGVAFAEQEKKASYQKTIDDINRKANIAVNKADTSFAFGKAYEYTPEKLTWTTRNYDTAELYKELSDGSLYKQFETYTPGINNYENFAQNQSTSEKWGHGLLKGADTFATTVLGGTVGVLVSIPTAIKEGSFSALYDNDFMREFDLHQEKMRIDYANYRTKEEQNMSFGQKLTTANFWADDAVQGVAFTAGALATEAIWEVATGGAGFATTGARWGTKVGNILNKVGRVADKTLDATQYVDDALRLAKLAKQEMVIAPSIATRNSLLKLNAGTIGGRVGEFTNITRSMLTSAGYESGFEARAYMAEARKDFKTQFEAENGRPPESGDLADFEDKLKSTANGLYAYNLALVGSSNLAQFGKLMNIKLPSTGVGELIDKKIFGVGTKVTEGAVEVLKATKLQKGLQIGYSLGKGALVEGAWEEGMQSVGKNTADMMIKSSYDKNLAKENYSLVESFSKSMAKTYGTKEGLNEVFTGMVIGALTGNVMGMVQTKGLNLNHEFANEIKRNEAIEKEFGKNSNYSSKVAVENMIMANRVLASNKAEENANKKGDLLGGQLARAGSLYAHFQRGNALNYLDEQVENLGSQIDLISEEDLAKSEGISLEQAKEAKLSMKEELTSQARNFKKINEFAGYIVGNKLRKGEFDIIKDKIGDNINKTQASDVLKQALTYELYMGEISHKHSEEMLGAFLNEAQDTIGSDETSKSFRIQNVIKNSTVKTQKELFKVKTELAKTKKELSEIEKTFRNLENIVAKATTPEQRQESLNKLNDLTVRRNELTEKEIELTSSWNVLYDSAKIENPLGENKKEFISSEDFINLDKNIQNTLSSIDALNETSPQKAERLKVLLREYEKSVSAYKRYSERTGQIVKLDLGRKNPFSTLLGASPNKQALGMIKGLMDTHFEKSTAQKEIIEDKIKTVTLEKEVKNGVSIKPEVEVKDESKNLVEYIKDLIKDNPYLFEQIDDNFEDTLPTDEELIEYIELYSPVLEDTNFNNKEFTHNGDIQLELFKKYLSEEEIKRLVELNTKFANWQLLEGASANGVSIAELIQQQAVLNQPVKEQTTDNVLTSEDVEKLEDHEENDRKFDILQTPANVFVRQDKGDIILSHLTPKKWLELQGQTVAEVTKKDSTASIVVDLNQINDVVEEGDLISYGNTTIKYVKGAKLVIKKSDFNLTYRNTKSGYSIVYDVDGNPMKSDFTDVDTYSAQEIYNLSSGDELKIVVDLEDSYNQTLQGKSDEDVENNLKISFFDNNGNKVADLKANYGGEENPQFLALRKRAFDLITSSNSSQIELGYVPVSTIFLGSPNIQLEQDNSIKEFDVVADNIVDYGTWDGSRTNLKGATKGVRTDFLKGLNKNLPIVVLKEGNVMFAYPASLKEVDRMLGDELMQKGLPKAQLAIEINRELKNNGIKSELFYISDDNTNMFQPDGKTSQELETAVEQLNTLKDKVDYKKTWFSKEHSKEQLSNEISLNVDSNGVILLSPKIVIEYSGLVTAKNNIQTAQKVSEEILEFLEAKKQLNKLTSTEPSNISENTFKYEGANFRYVVDPQTGVIYSMGIANKNFEKLVSDFEKAPKEGKEQILNKIKKIATNRGKTFFDRYGNAFEKVKEMEDRINSDFLLKAEYEDLLKISPQMKQQAKDNKKC